MSDRKLRVFLCHASQDKPIVRELYQRLLAEGWIDPWLDEEKLLPGQDWDMEIEKAVEASDAVIVSLSNKSVTKEGYIQRELRFALDIALEKPEGTIFIIPLRLDDCVPPRRLRAWQYVDFFPVERRDLAYHRLVRALSLRNNPLEQVSEIIAPGSKMTNQQPGARAIPSPAPEIQLAQGQSKHTPEKKVSIGLILSLLGMIPVVGIAPALFGLIVGFSEYNTKVKNQATAAIVLGLVFICLWGFVFYMDATAQWCTFLPFLTGCS